MCRTSFSVVEVQCARQGIPGAESGEAEQEPGLRRACIAR